MSTNVVVPDSIISSAASSVPTRTNSGETTFASAGKMYSFSQRISGRSSASPRMRTIAAWVCVFTRPGSTIWPRVLISCAGPMRALTSSAGPTSRMRSSSIATAPSGITRRASSIVTTTPPVRRSRRGLSRRMAMSSQATEATRPSVTSHGAVRRIGRFYGAPGPSVHSSAVPVHLVQHPVTQDAVTYLRDKSTTASRFRRLAHRVSLILAIEATRKLPMTLARVETPLEPARGEVLDANVVVVPVLRAGLGMVEAVLSLIPTARVGHIGLQRDEHTAIASRYYTRLPADLSNATALVVDPMLATGGSALAAIALLEQAGARDIRLVCIVAAPEGIAAVEAAHPTVAIFTPVIDRQLNAQKFILPGLGDF